MTRECEYRSKYGFLQTNIAIEGGATIDVCKARLVRFEHFLTMCGHCLATDWLLVMCSSCA